MLKKTMVAVIFWVISCRLVYLVKAELQEMHDSLPTAEKRNLLMAHFLCWCFGSLNCDLLCFHYL